MNSRNFAYIRVSTKDQNLDRQIDAIKALNIEIDERDIYVDKQSGKDFNRQEWQSLKRTMRTGDTLYVKELDRLGRNKAGIMEEWKWLADNKIFIVIIDRPLLDTRKYSDMNGVGELITNLVLEILSWIAEEERTQIKIRQKEGITSARKRGAKFGRPVILVTEDFNEICKMWKDGEITAVKAMQLSKLKKTTFYNKAKLLQEKRS